MKLDVIKNVEASAVGPGDVVDCVDGLIVTRLWVDRVERDHETVDLLGWPEGADHKGRRTVFRSKPDELLLLHAPEAVALECGRYLARALMGEHGVVGLTGGGVGDSAVTLLFHEDWAVVLECATPVGNLTDEPMAKEGDAEQTGTAAEPPGEADAAGTLRGG